MVYEAAAIVEVKISEGLNHYNDGMVERRAHVKRNMGHLRPREVATC